MIQKEESGIYNGYRGTLISKFELFTITNGSGSVGERLREGYRDEAWQNPCTGEQELIDYEELLAGYPDINPNEAFLKISWNFIVEHDEITDDPAEQNTEKNPPQSPHLRNFGKNIRKPPQVWPVFRNAPKPIDD